MKDHIKKIIIASDNFPLEQFKSRPITNFFRRLLHGRYRVCEECWKREEREMYRQGIRSKIVAEERLEKLRNPHLKELLETLKR